MASSEQQCLRFFVMACCFGLLIGVFGCATNNWSEPLFGQGAQSNRLEQSVRTCADDDTPPKEAPSSLKQKWNRFWNAGFGSASGLDPKAREIEKSLGL
jgi:hypothetical protein